jgi:hypothetical protein
LSLTEGTDALLLGAKAEPLASLFLRADADIADDMPNWRCGPPLPSQLRPPCPTQRPPSICLPW